MLDLKSRAFLSSELMLTLSLPPGAAVSCAWWSVSLWGPSSSSSCHWKLWRSGGPALPMDALQI